jgi:hypothetical protein
MNDERKKLEKWKADPFFSLIKCEYFPDNTGVATIDAVLAHGVAMIKERYPDALADKENASILRVFEATAACNDSVAKLFAIFLIMCYEPKFCNFFESLYRHSGPGIFGDLAPSIFRKTVLKMKENRDKLFRFTYDVANIVECVTRFVEDISTKYFLG